MTRIDEWDVHRYDDERGWVRRHKYSKFEEPTDEPLPPAYEPPTTGSAEVMAAAFNAEAGINADPAFDMFSSGVYDNLDDLFNFDIYSGSNYK